MSSNKRKTRTHMSNLELHPAVKGARAGAKPPLVRASSSAAKSMAKAKAGSRVISVIADLIQEEEEQRLENQAQGFSFRRKLSF